MRCPKCHYISFGSTDRCRNCGYEFLLAAEPLALELPIQDVDAPLGPLADFALSEVPPERAPRAGVPQPAGTDAAGRRLSAAQRFDLPLFGSGERADDVPLVTPSAIPRTPLSVRRAPPPIARPRADRSLLDGSASAAGAPRAAQGRVAPFPREAAIALPEPRAIEPAPALARLLSALLDLTVLGAIDAGIVYFTLLVLDLPLADARNLPQVPLAVFLLLLNGGYLAIFTAAGGQTIGKMLAGIKVVSDAPSIAGGPNAPGSRVTLGASVLRATAYLVSLLPAGLGFAAILFDANGRALHDRLAETRVVKA
jgi:uncharacterized RDD family membrane protein YckC